MIRLIASDMDGTLLDAKMAIPKENVEAIKYAESKGVKFMVATGRGYTEAHPVLEESGINCEMITVNGAQVFDANGAIEFTVEIDKERTKEIISIFEEENIYFEVCTNQGVYSNNNAQRLENAAMMIANNFPHLTFKMALSMAAAHLALLSIRYVENYHELVADPKIQILKFIAFSQEEQPALQKAAAKIRPLGELAITSSHPTNIEINHADAQKGIALQHVAKNMGIPMSEVMAIGDNFNDVSMLEVAGVSFAMENAEEGVKAKAKYITGLNVEGGVGKAIRRAIDENLQ